METTDLKAVAELYKRLIEETQGLSQTESNSGYWKYRLAEMKNVLELIDTNLSLRNACSTVLQQAV